MTEPAVLVAGRYRLEERIGAGAMGVVWRAVDERLWRTVAIKQLLVPAELTIAAADEARQRIMREGRIAARLQHQNAVAVFDVADHDGAPWLVMEYVRSRSLATVLTERGALPPAEVAGIGRQLADALAAAHAAGIVHRDVKPGNVLIGDDGTVKLTDFGISRAVDDVTVTRTGMLAGTPAYLAPEVARGAEPTPASDTFALGSTLYAAVEGEPPFGLSDNQLALLYRVAAGVVRPPRQAGPLTSLLMRLLRSDPAERPTMAQVRELLAAVAASAVVGQPPGAPGFRQPPAQRTPPPTRVGRPVVEPAERPSRRTALAAAAAGLLAVLAVVSVLAAMRDPGQPVTLPTTSTAAAPPVASSTAPAPVTTSQRPAPPSQAQLRDAVAAYYRLVPDDLDRAWQRLGPGLQAQGFAQYQRFWQQFKSVQALVGQADPQRLTVRVVVVFRRDDDKRRITELHELTLIQDGGRLLIDGDDYLGPTTVPQDDQGNDEGDEDRGNGSGRGGSGGGDG